MAQMDADGNVNVSRFGDKLTGAGGFINISQSARVVVFTGTFSTSGLNIAAGDGQLRIEREGAYRKLVKSVQQITFNGKFASSQGQRVLYVTERAVFQATPDGLMLIEVAPGVDLDRDVLGQMDFTPIIAEDLGQMDTRLFVDELMGLAHDVPDGEGGREHADSVPR
jgi:propionate CoA-transferase